MNGVAPPGPDEAAGEVAAAPIDSAATAPGAIAPADDGPRPAAQRIATPVQTKPRSSAAWVRDNRSSAV